MMPRSRLPLTFALAGALAAHLRAEDVALVPLDGGGQAVLEALEMIDAGRLRDGVAALQDVLVRESGASKAAAYLVEVPPELPRDPRALLEALRRLGRRPAAAGGLVPADPVDAPVAATPDGPEERELPIIPGAGPEDGRRFLPAAELASYCLSILPAPALAAYRELYDGLAASLLARFHSGGRREHLERAARELYFTAAGAGAAEILGDSSFLAASYGEALASWRRLVRDRRGGEADQRRLHQKLVRALGALRLVQEHELERGRFLARWPDGAAELEPVAEVAASLPRAPGPPSRWGGELDARLPALLPAPAGQPVEPLLELSWDTWSWALQGLGTASGGGLGRHRLLAMQGLEGVHFPFIPVADGDDVYLSGVFNLYRFDGRPGHGSLTLSIAKPLPGADLHQYEERPDQDSALYTVTLWRSDSEPGWSAPDFPGEVLITHYISDRILEKKYLGYFIQVEIAIRSLVAFEARSGRLLWQTAGVRRQPQAARLPPRDDGAFLEPDEPLERFQLPAGRGRSPLELDDADAAIARDFSYTSPAVVRGGLVIAGGWHQRGYVTSAVRALDLRTGKLVWETVLGGAQVEPTMFGEMAREPLSTAIAEREGTVYFLTQMGAIAALEARTGALRWLSTYDALPLEATFSPRPELRRLLWGQNPLLLLGNALICTPRDSELLYAFDSGEGPLGAAEGGRRLWSYQNPGHLRDLLGHAGGYLYLLGGGESVGASEITALDLRELDAAGALPGRAASPERAGSLALPTRVPGRAALTREGIVLADAERLWLADLDLGAYRPLLAAPYRTPERGAYPGRLTVDGSGRVLMTSRSLLSAFFPAAAKSP